MTRARLSRAAAALLPIALLSACGGGGATEDGEVTLTLAHSYTEEQAPHTCGAAVIKDEIESADVDMGVEIYPASQLGGDDNRVPSVQFGDVDIDIQGASALSALYEPVGVVDAAYAFDDSDDLVEFFRDDASRDLKRDFTEASDGVRILGAWSIGARQFTANKPIREPSDLEGMRMRFPGSPVHLKNADALGANATEVAFEELFLGLQQGTVDGQENPLSNIKSNNLQEVQDQLSLSGHAENSNLVVVGEVYDSLTPVQKRVLDDAVQTAVDKVPGCVEQAEKEILEEYRSGDDITVVDDVDREAFRSQTDAWMRKNLESDSLEVYEAIREGSS